MWWDLKCEKCEKCEIPDDVYSTSILVEASHFHNLKRSRKPLLFYFTTQQPDTNQLHYLQITWALRKTMPSSFWACSDSSVLACTSAKTICSVQTPRVELLWSTGPKVLHIPFRNGGRECVVHCSSRSCWGPSPLAFPWKPTWNKRCWQWYYCWSTWFGLTINRLKSASASHGTHKLSCKLFLFWSMLTFLQRT